MARVPHCIAEGKTPEDAIRHGREALEACLVTIANLENAFRNRSQQPAADSGVKEFPGACMRVWSSVPSGKVLA